MVYLSWEVLSALLDKIKVNKKEAAFFLLSILWLLMSFRSPNMGISDVKAVYYPLFTNCQNVSMISLINEKGIFNEPLMIAITWIFSRTLLNFQLYLSAMSLFPLISLYKFICKNSVNYIQSTVVFFSFFFFYESYLIKQMFALSIILYAYNALNNRQGFKFFLYIMLAGLIHKSAFFILPVYFLCKYLKFNKYFFIFVIAGISIGMFGGQSILNVLYKFSFYNFESYIKNGVYGTDGSINFSMFLYVGITFFAYFMLRKKETSKINDYLILMFLGCIINSWSVVVVEFYRVAIYFMVVSCLMIPEAIAEIPKKYRKLVTALIFAFICAYAFKIADNCNSLPFRTFLFE